MLENSPNIDNRGDVEDLKEARDGKAPPVRRSFWGSLGPGLVSGAADDDPTAVGTFSIAGAEFGYSLCWSFLVITPLMIAIQEMCGRIGAVTGKGLVGALDSHFPRWMVWGAIIGLFAANIINVWADLNIMAASAKMLLGHSTFLWLSLITLGCILSQILIPYNQYVKILKWLTVALFSYVVTVFLPGVHNDWAAIFHNTFIPAPVGNHEYLLTLFALFGGAISPYLFFWQAGGQVEEVVSEGNALGPGERTSPAVNSEIRMMRNDTIAGMLVAQGVGFFILICAASTLHAAGVTQLDTAEQAASALLPLGGKLAFVIFTTGIFASGLLAIPALAGSAGYALAEMLGWKWGLYRRFQRAPFFYGSIAAVTLAGYALNFFNFASPVKGLLYAAICNGIVAPPLVLFLLILCNKRDVMGRRRNGLAHNILGVITAVLMIAGSLMSLSSLFMKG